MLGRSEFREDLYYRLKVIEIVVPPLRHRHDEIPQLIEFFVDKYSKRYNRPEPSLSPALLEALQNYSWPGNIRELENIMKRLVILQDEALLLRDLQSADRRAHAPTPRAEERVTLPGATFTTPGDGADEVWPQPGPSENPAGGNAPQATSTAATGSLAEVARRAIVQAERDLIVPTLRGVHWNRRMAAPLLGISYKTLLYKIKEHGIIQD
jgi:two-component system response regulator AtoC